MGRIWPDTISFENREGAKEGRQPLGAGKKQGNRFCFRGAVIFKCQSHGSEEKTEELFEGH